MKNRINQSLNGQIEYQMNDFSVNNNKQAYYQQNSNNLVQSNPFYNNTSTNTSQSSDMNSMITYNTSNNQQGAYFSSQYSNFYNTSTQSHFDFVSIPQGQAGPAATTMTPPPSNTNTPTPTLNSCVHQQHQLNVPTYNQSTPDKKNPKIFKPLVNSQLPMSKKEIENFEDFTDTICNKANNSLLDDDDDLEEDEEDEFSDDDDEDDEDDEEEDFEGSNYLNSAKNGNKKRKTEIKAKNCDIDNENDYEIKHNCLTEEGAYLNTLFNSPSSLSSSSLNQSQSAIKPIFGVKSKRPQIISGQNPKRRHAHTNKLKFQELKTQESKIDSVSVMEQNGQHILVTKVEVQDESEHLNQESNLNDTSKNFYQQHQLQAQATYQPHSATNQHMNNMINSYSLAGIMNDFDLVNLPLRELNKRLRFLPKQMAYNMKKRRRTLKNRKYAQNCRSKRLEQKSEMEIQNSQLKIEITRLNRLVEKIQSDYQMLKSYMSKPTKIENSQSIVFEENTKNKMISSLNQNQNLNQNENQSLNCNQLTHLLSLPNVLNKESCLNITSYHQSSLMNNK